VRSVPYSDEWEVARGAVVPRTTLGNLSIAMVLRTTLAKPGIRPIVNICNGM
jgi:hypothetical protein